MIILIKSSLYYTCQNDSVTTSELSKLPYINGNFLMCRKMHCPKSFPVWFRKNSKYLFPNKKSHLCTSPGPSAKCGRTKILRDKVAIVTGGACGIGYFIVREFLKRGACGVTIADANACTGEQTCKCLSEEFGKGRTMFVQCDVTKSELLDWVYKQTIKYFGFVDVMVNNAGIMNDIKWEETLNTNIGGTLVGSLLAIQYMSKHSIGKGGIVINIASTCGVKPLYGYPIYSTSQAAIIALSRALGDGSQYDRTGVKVIAYCPGPTDTPLLTNSPTYAMNDKFRNEFVEEMEDELCQEPEFVAKALITVLRKAESGSVWVVSNGEAPYEIGLPNSCEDIRCP